MTVKEKIISFAWQHILLLFALYIMTLGIALCVKSMLGSSVISVLPYVFHDAGTNRQVPALTIGQYTFIMNALLVVGQIGILRRAVRTCSTFPTARRLCFWFTDKSERDWPNTFIGNKFIKISCISNIL